jgi:hypothetical protein
MCRVKWPFTKTQTQPKLPKMRRQAAPAAEPASNTSPFLARLNLEAPAPHVFGVKGGECHCRLHIHHTPLFLPILPHTSCTRALCAPS